MATSLQPCEMEAAAPCVQAAARCVQASYVATSAGDAQLRVTLAGEHIAGSPFATRVRAGSATASCSSAHGEGLRGAVAGEAAALSLRMRDQLGNGAPLSLNQAEVVATHTRDDGFSV